VSAPMPMDMTGCGIGMPVCVMSTCCYRIGQEIIQVSKRGDVINWVGYAAQIRQRSSHAHIN